MQNANTTNNRHTVTTYQVWDRGSLIQGGAHFKEEMPCHKLANKAFNNTPMDQDASVKVLRVTRVFDGDLCLADLTKTECIASKSDSAIIA